MEKEITIKAVRKVTDAIARQAQFIDMKETTLSDKRSEILKWYAGRINIVFKDNKIRREAAEIVGQILRDVDLQDKEFIKKLKEDYDKCGFSKLTNSFLHERIDKLAGKELKWN